MEPIILSQGNPIDTIPENVIEELGKQILIPNNHRYPQNESEGYNELRKEVYKWYQRRYAVNLDSINNVGILIGSKEGILYFLLSQVDIGDYVIITNPCYQTYKYLINLVGGIPYELNINIQNSFLPDLENVPEEILRKAKAIIINYPNNPTCAVATKCFFDSLVRFAINYDIKIVNDNPYSEFIIDTKNKLSLLNSIGADKVGIELNSFSKTFNMAGWRLGMVIGNESIISKMVKIKQMVDAGPFLALQKAALIALNEKNDFYVDNMAKKFATRKQRATEELAKLGWDHKFQQGTYYLWLLCRDTSDSVVYSEFLKKRANLHVTPGTKYGTNGEGYIRISLALTDEEFEETLFRLNQIYK